MRVLNVTGPVAAVAFSPDGATLSCGSNQGVQFCDLALDAVSLTVRSGVRLPPGPPLLFAPDGPRVTFNRLSFDPTVPAARAGGTVRMGELSYRGVPGAPIHFPIAYDRDQGLAVTVTRDALLVHRPSSGKEAYRLYNPERRLWPPRWNGCESLSLSPDGQTAAAAFVGPAAFLIDLPAGPVTQLPHAGQVTRVLFGPDGALLATATAERVVRLWDVAGRREAARFPQLARKVTALAFSPDGRLLAAGSADGTVRLWDVKRRLEAARYDWGVGAVTAVAFAPDGQRAAAGGASSAVIWDVDV
jgi:WD40 repeat protein